MILVCAAGLDGSVAIDAAKEVAIYRAHKATPVVITDTPEVFSSALKVIEVPPTVKELAFILSTMAGHILVMKPHYLSMLKRPHFEKFAQQSNQRCPIIRI